MKERTMGNFNLEIASRQPREGSASTPMEKHDRLRISTILTHGKISQQRSGSPINTNFNNSSIETTAMEDQTFVRSKPGESSLDRGRKLATSGINS